jgi:hypothetical protein
MITNIKEVLPFGSPLYLVYIHESSTLAKANEIKAQCHWEHLGEHMENKKIIKNLSSPKPKRK